jgi:acetyl-CoA acetyltransferase
VVRSDRARALRHRPVLLAGAAQGQAGAPMRNWYRARISEAEEMEVVAGRLWSGSGLGPGDVQAAILYDHFLPLVLPQLEAFGFCERGEAKHFVADGGTALDGRLPVNTNGGQTGEAYVHGMNGLAEAVRQLRGDAVNQLPALERVLVTSGPGVPTSALILEGAT